MVSQYNRSPMVLELQLFIFLLFCIIVEHVPWSYFLKVSYVNFVASTIQKYGIVFTMGHCAVIYLKQ